MLNQASLIGLLHSHAWNGNLPEICLSTLTSESKSRRSCMHAIFLDLQLYFICRAPRLNDLALNSQGSVL